MIQTFVIVGGGQAAGQAAATLRQERFDGRLVLVGEESHLPYERPPLSKEVLLGRQPSSFCRMQEADFYQKGQIELRLGRTVTAIDRERQAIVLDDGNSLVYDKLLLCTGSRLRRLEVPGHDLDGIVYLRTIDDAERLREHLTPGTRVAVIGGGYIGLEVAAAAQQRGAQVTVLEAMDEIMARVMPREAAVIVREYHSRNGIGFRTNFMVAKFTGRDTVSAVLDEGGGEIAADLAVVGIGIQPRTELAKAAGLNIHDGILVDEYGRTSDANIFAAGDVARAPNFGGSSMRIESWQNAQRQGTVAAKAMLGRLETDPTVPWFWSNQGDLKIETLGVPGTYDTVVIRGDRDRPSCSVFTLKDAMIVSVNTLNASQDIRPAKTLLQQRVRVPAAVLERADVPLKQIVREFS
jgi:3-phenylpropionate/trans-cinnamate dioxygenase ferredoxin reductase subunit